VGVGQQQKRSYMDIFDDRWLADSTHIDYVRNKRQKPRYLYGNQRGLIGSGDQEKGGQKSRSTEIPRRKY